MWDYIKYNSVTVMIGKGFLAARIVLLTPDQHNDQQTFKEIREAATSDR